jgi:hypothetical protein
MQVCSATGGSACGGVCDASSGSCSLG